MGQKYRRIEDLKSLPVGPKPGFCKGRGLKLIVEEYKYLAWKRVEKTSVIQRYHRWESGGGAPSCRRLCGSGGKAPSRWAIFCNFLEKKAILMPLNHNSQVFRAI